MELNDSFIQNGTTLLTNDTINLTVNVIAENLTSRLVTDSSIWSEAVTYLPILSIIIAFYSIYLSQLAGAKISLVERPKIELLELKKEEFNEEYIPVTLSIKKLSLFFINSGNRAGILKDVRASVRLEPNTKIYLKELSLNIIYGNKSDNNDFLIILDKSVGNVFIEQINLSAINIGKGKPFKNFYVIQENQNLFKIIDNIFDIQKTNLKDFIGFIEQNHTFGDLEISYMCTGREYWIKEKIKKEKLNLKMEGKYIDTVKGYRELLNKWDVLPSTDERVISDIKQFLDNNCKNIIKNNMDKLITMQGIEDLPDLRYIDLLEKFYFEYNILKKWKTSKIYSEKLYNLIEKMKDYKKIYDKVLIYPTLHDDWKLCRKDLENQCSDVFEQTYIIIKKIQNTREQEENEGNNWYFRCS